MGNYISSYISCSEAGRALGRKTVATAAHGRDPQAYGYIWIYKAIKRATNTNKS